jgi:hypothetical protein
VYIYITPTNRIVQSKVKSKVTLRPTVSQSACLVDPAAFFVLKTTRPVMIHFFKPFFVTIIVQCKISKETVTGSGGAWGCETSRLPHFIYKRLSVGGTVGMLKFRLPFIPQEDCWNSFLLEAESTPGPWRRWKDWVN